LAIPLTFLLVAVPVADHAMKWLVRRALGARSLSLGAFGEVRIRQARIWLLRASARSGSATLSALWLASAGVLLFAAIALSLPGWSIGLLLGGSISHLLETVRRGSVSDYVALRGWPAFDLADVALVIGAGGTLGAFAVSLGSFTR
jgi:lipoprotein signal peptidase